MYKQFKVPDSPTKKTGETTLETHAASTTDKHVSGAFDLRGSL